MCSGLLRGSPHRTCIATFCLVVLGGVAFARADQLAVLPKPDCRRVLKLLPPGSRVASFCSLCDTSRVEVWRVEQAVKLKWDKAHGEVGVFVRRVAESPDSYGRSRLPGAEPIPMVPLKAKEGKGSRRVWAFETLDLAYVYVETKRGRWDCLGKLLGLACEVSAPTLQLQFRAPERPSRKPPVPSDPRI